jgi:TP901 family phage tail tape measure protein
MGALGKIAAPVGLTAGLLDAASAGGDFARALAVLEAKSGATADQMAALRAKALELGRVTTFGPAKITEAFDALSSAGLNANQVLASAESTLKFAQAAKGLSIGEAAEAVAQSMAVFGTSAKDVGGLLDKMAKSSDMFALNLKDLPLGLANANRGISAMGASSDEALLAFGLMRNMIPRVASAGTAAGMAMEAMASPKVIAALKGIGIGVADSAGKFRPFLDIVGELGPKLQGMTQVKRANFLRETFGADAVQGITAILGQIEKGLEGPNGQILRGADAIAHLRGQMAGSQGTLDRFAGAMGSGFTGSLERAKARMETLKAVVGESIGSIIAPQIERATDVVAKMAGSFEGLSASGKQAVATLLIVGAVAGVAFAVFGGPAAAAVLGLAAAASVLKGAYDSNLGGIADKLDAFVAKTKLIGTALFEGLAGGGISSGVMKELNASGNEGSMAFVTNVIDGFQRAGEFARTLGESVSGIFDSPAIEAMGASLSKLGESLGLTTSSADGAKGKWESWGNAGRIAGDWIKAALEVAAQKVTQVSDFVNGFAKHWDTVKSGIDPVIGLVKTIVAEVQSLAGQMGLLNPSAGRSGWEKFGSIVGAVVGAISRGIGSVAEVLSGLTKAFSGVITFFKGLLTGDWKAMWDGAKKVVLGLGESIVSILGGALATIGKMIDSMGKMAGIDIGAEAFANRVKNDAKSFLTDTKDAELGSSSDGPFSDYKRYMSLTPSDLQQAQLRMSATAATPSGDGSGAADVADAIKAGYAENSATFLSALDKKPTTIIVNIDGEEIRRDTRRGGSEPTRD